MKAPEPALRRLRVLLVDGAAEERRALQRLIEPLAGEVRDAESGERALEVLAEWTPHVLVADLELGAVSGMELLRHLREHQPEVRVLVVTGYGTIELAVEAMRHGAANFLAKPFDDREIVAEVRLHGREALIGEGVRRMQAAAGEEPATIIAQDRKMATVLDLVRRVGPSAMPVLIRGETGTGKEVVARLIHRHSRDPALPFLAVNSAALPDLLLESELFGHVKGAFTGADRHREGIFVAARGGTVFLDEIPSMSLAFQATLLRVLEEHTVVPLGSSTPRTVDFRLVAATNRSLRQRIEEGKFRQDLYFRLRVVPITVPPLRQRPADVIPLAVHFIARFAGEAGLARPPGLTTGAVEALQAHHWPGNVRELENSIQRALILCRGRDIRLRHLGLGMESGAWAFQGIPETETLSYEEGKQRAVEAFQQRIVRRALRATGGNVTQAAEMCGLTRAAFQRIMRALDIDRAQFTGQG